MLNILQRFFSYLGNLRSSTKPKSPQDNPVQSDNPQAETGNENHPPVSSVVQSHIPPPPEHPKQTEHCRPDQTPIGKYFLEVLAACILAAYTVAAFMQLGVMSGQLTQMQGASNQTDQMLCLVRQQVEQATKQTAALQHQLTAFEDSQKAVLRPEIEISSDQSKVTFVVKNVGHSAARNIAMHADARITPIINRKPRAQDLKQYLRRIPTDATGPVLGEGEEKRSEIGIENKTELTHEVARQGQSRVLYITVSYNDIFGGTEAANACMYYTVHGPPRIWERIGGTFDPCPSIAELEKEQRKK